MRVEGWRETVSKFIQTHNRCTCTVVMCAFLFYVSLFVWFTHIHTAHPTCRVLRRQLKVPNAANQSQNTSKWHHQLTHRYFPHLLVFTFKSNLIWTHPCITFWASSGNKYYGLKYFWCLWLHGWRYQKCNFFLSTLLENYKDVFHDFRKRKPQVKFLLYTKTLSKNFTYKLQLL